MSFNQFELSREILRRVQELGYKDPTEIQTKVIPLVLKKKDLLAGAETGTGKTASFMLPLLHLLNTQTKEKSSKKPRALILTPTRELASQVHENAKEYGKYLPLKASVVFGGVPIRSQIMEMRKGIDILIATPGRLLDHVNQKTVDLSAIDYLVLDEADCMLDMGFIHDLRKILASLVRPRQTMLFSATFSDPILKLAEDLLIRPERIQMQERNAVSGQVKQVAYPVDRTRKTELLKHLIKEQNWDQVLVFTRTRHSANRLYEALNKEGIDSDAIHGDKRQSARAKALVKFKKGKTRVLVATDVAARGLDIQNLPHVVNFELPCVASDYIHRVGRTGRAGNKGEAVTLVCIDEQYLLRDIENLMQKEIPKVYLDGFEIDPSIKPDLVRRGGRGRSKFSPKTKALKGPSPKSRRSNAKEFKHFRPKEDAQKSKKTFSGKRKFLRGV